jgi:hypothetical protein
LLKSTEVACNLPLRRRQLTRVARERLRVFSGRKNLVTVANQLRGVLDAC